MIGSLALQFEAIPLEEGETCVGWDDANRVLCEVTRVAWWAEPLIDFASGLPFKSWRSAVTIFAIQHGVDIEPKEIWPLDPAAGQPEGD